MIEREPLLNAFIILAEQLRAFRSITDRIQIKVPKNLYARLENEMSRQDLLFNIRPPVRGKETFPTFIMIDEFLDIEPK